VSVQIRVWVCVRVSVGFYVLLVHEFIIKRILLCCLSVAGVLPSLCILVASYTPTPGWAIWAPPPTPTHIQTHRASRSAQTGGCNHKTDDVVCTRFSLNSLVSLVGRTEKRTHHKNAVLLCRQPAFRLRRQQQQQQQLLAYPWHRPRQ
jgi:hypothetical protein